LIVIRPPKLFSERRRLLGATRDLHLTSSLRLVCRYKTSVPLALFFYGMSDIFKDKLFALELGLSVPFKQKAGLSKLISDNGGKVAYMINKKVRATVTKL